MLWWVMAHRDPSVLLVATALAFIAATSEAMPTDVTAGAATAEIEMEEAEIGDFFFLQDFVWPDVFLAKWPYRYKRSADSTGSATGTDEQSTTAVPGKTVANRYAFWGGDDQTMAAHLEQPTTTMPRKTTGDDDPKPTAYSQYYTSMKSHDNSASISPDDAVLESSSRDASTDGATGAQSPPVTSADNSGAVTVAALQLNARADDSSHEAVDDSNAKVTTEIYSDSGDGPLDIDIDPQVRKSDGNSGDPSMPAAPSDVAVASTTPVSEKKVSETAYLTMAPGTGLPYVREGMSAPKTEAVGADIAASTEQRHAGARQQHHSASFTAQAQTSEPVSERKSNARNGPGNDESTATGHANKSSVVADNHASSNAGDRADDLPQSGQPGVPPGNLQTPRVEGAQDEALRPAQLAQMVTREGRNPDTPKDSGSKLSGRSSAEPGSARAGPGRAAKDNEERSGPPHGAESKPGDAPATAGVQPRQDTPKAREPITGIPGVAGSDPLPSAQAGSVPANSPGQPRIDAPRAPQEEKLIGAVPRTEGEQTTGRGEGASEAAAPAARSTGETVRGDKTSAVQSSEQPRAIDQQAGPSKQDESGGERTQPQRQGPGPQDMNTPQADAQVAPEQRGSANEGGRGADAQIPRSSQVKPETAREDNPQPQRGDAPKSDSGFHESGSQTQGTSKLQGAPRSADDHPTGGVHTASQPQSPKGEQSKPGQKSSADGGEGVVGRDDDSSKPKGGTGGTVRQEDAPNKAQDTARSADGPAVATMRNGGQAPSRRAEQPKPGQIATADEGKGVVGSDGDSAKPKVSTGESVSQGDAPNKPQDIARSADGPAAATTSNGGQAQSPRAEQPKPGHTATTDGAKGVVGRDSGSAKPKSDTGESVRQGDAPNKPRESYRSTDGRAAATASNGGQAHSPRAEQPKLGQTGSADGGKGVVGTDGDSAKPRGSTSGSARGDAPKTPQEAPRTAGGFATAATDNGGQSKSPRAEQPKPQEGQKGTSGSSAVPRAEQSVPAGVKTPIFLNSGETKDSQPEALRAAGPNGPAVPSSGNGETVPGKNQEAGRTDHGKAKAVVVVNGDDPVSVTVPKDSTAQVTVENKKEAENEENRDETVKKGGTTESETHVSVDDTTADKTAKPAVIETKEPSAHKKQEESEPELKIRNITIEVEPEPDKKASKKPEHTVPVVPPAPHVVYPAPVIADHPYPQHPQHTVYQPYQPYQPYQIPAHKPPTQPVVYNPYYQPRYHPIPHTGYVPSAPLLYMPEQHGNPIPQAPSNYYYYQELPHEPHYHQPYASYQPAHYDPVHQPGYYSPNGHGYGPANYASDHPVYNKQQPAMHATEYRPRLPHGILSGHYGPNAANYRVVYPPRHSPPRNPQQRSYRTTRHPATQIHHGVPHGQNLYQPRMVPAYRVQQPPLAHVRYQPPAVKAPKHQPGSHGGYKRHLSEEHLASAFHFPPAVIYDLTSHEPAPSTYKKPEPQAGKPSHMSERRNLRTHDQPMIVAAYWRSADGAEASSEGRDQSWAVYPHEEEYAATGAPSN